MGCSVGSYVSDVGASACLACAEGKYSISFGVSSCTTCPVAKYLSNATSAVCTLCPAGTYAPMDGATRCRGCEPGKFSGTPSDSAQNSACTLCAPGKYSPSASSSECTSCSAGTVSEAATGSTMCTECEAGYYSPPQASGSSSSCLACGPGNFSSTKGSTHCERCPAGTRSLQPSSGSTGCLACLEGTYAASEGQTSCAQCSPPCVAGKTYPSVNCTPGTNRVCSACSRRECPANQTSNLSACLADGSFACVPCPAYGNDHVHLMPEYSCLTCKSQDCGRTPGTYQASRCPSSSSSSSLNNTYACGRCTGCLYRHYVQSWSFCDGKGSSPFQLETGNPEFCARCQTTCRGGQYIVNLCNGRTTANTERCANCTSCAMGHYHARPLLGLFHPAFDGEPWTENYVEDSPCDGTGILNSDGSSDCERCDACPSGKYASDVRRCTGNGVWKDNFTCTDCVPCESGYEHASPCDGLSFDTSCRKCPNCAAGHHAVSHWNETTKRMVCGCTRCMDRPGDSCATHFRRTNRTCSGNATRDESCEECSLCNAGEYVGAAPNGSFCTGAGYEDASAGKCR
jgi:hypothetical protein